MSVPPIDEKVKMEESKGDEESKSQFSPRTSKKKTSVKPPPRLKRKNTSLREALERRVGEVEKLVESKAEKIYMENMEKRAWLQAMEAWIVHKYKTRTVADNQHEEPMRGYSSDSELNNPDKKRSRREKNKLPGEDNNEHVSVVHTD